jgi:PKD repeat protein
MTAASLLGGTARAATAAPSRSASPQSAATAAATSPAGSIVYLKGGNVWIAHADGTHARQFTTRKLNWSSPSEADNGTVVVAGGLSRINKDGSDSSGSSEIYRFKPNGQQIGGVIPTWGSYSTPSCPTYGPNSVRVSPDASKIAYGIWECGDDSYTALWTPATATGLKFPSQTLGQEDFYEPYWINNSEFVVSHAGPTVSDSQARWFVHKTTQADDTGVIGWNWAAMTGTGAQAVLTKTGSILAVFEDDAADRTNGKPRTVRLWLFSDLVNGSYTKNCTVKLNAASTSHPLQLSPSFSTDGKELLWGDDKGVEVASTTNPGNCGAVKPRLLIPGGSQPFFSGGVEKPALPVAAFGVSPGVPRHGAAATFNGGSSHELGGKIKAWAWKFGDGHTAAGAKVSHRFAKAGTYKVTLTVTDAAGQHATVTRKVKVS